MPEIPKREAEIPRQAPEHILTVQEGESHALTIRPDTFRKIVLPADTNEIPPQVFTLHGCDDASLQVKRAKNRLMLTLDHPKRPLTPAEDNVPIRIYRPDNDIRTTLFICPNVPVTFEGITGLCIDVEGGRLSFAVDVPRHAAFMVNPKDLEAGVLVSKAQGIGMHPNWMRSMQTRRDPEEDR